MVGTVLELAARGTSYAMSAPTIVEVEDRKLKLTNLHQDLYPATGFTKGQVVDFYVHIAPGRFYWRRQREGPMLLSPAPGTPTVLGTGSEGKT